MAVEKFLSVLVQYHIEKAAGAFEQVVGSLAKGESEQARGSLAEANRLLEQARGVQRIIDRFVNDLNRLGTKQPTLEYYLARLLVNSSLQQTTTPIVLPDILSSIPEVTRESAITVSQEYRKPNRVCGDLGTREEKLAYMMFVAKEDRSDLAHPSLESVVGATFEDKLSGVTDKHIRKRMVTRYTLTVEQMRSNIAYKLNEAARNPNYIPHFMDAFLQWVKNQPEYSNLTIAEVAAFFKGNLKFRDLRVKFNRPQADQKTEEALVEPAVEESISSIEQSAEQKVGELAASIKEVVAPIEETAPIPERATSDAKFTPSETTLLAQLIYQASKQLGIDLLDEDRDEVKKIQDRLSQETDGVVDLENFGAKLIAFIKDKKTVFMANPENEDAQYLLTLLVMTSEDKIRGFLNSITQEVKKNS